MNVSPCDCRTLPHIAQSGVLQSCWGANTVPKSPQKTFDIVYNQLITNIEQLPGVLFLLPFHQQALGPRLKSR